MGGSSRSSVSSADEDYDKLPTMVAIDRDKNSQYAVRWAVDNFKLRNTRLALVHVNTRDIDNDVAQEGLSPAEIEADFEKLFVPYRGYCGRKGVLAEEVILHNSNIATALGNFMHSHSVTRAVLGFPARNALMRAFRNPDVPTTVSKYAPDDCTVFIVSKGKAVKIKSSSTTSDPGTPNSTITQSSKASSSSFSQDSIRSASNFSSFDGSHTQRKHSSSSLNSVNNNREYLRGIFGSNTSSPQHSVTSNEFRPGSKTPSPSKSTNTSFESNPTSSTYSSPFHSGTGDIVFGLANKQPRSKLSTMAKPRNQVRVLTKDDPNHSGSGSSNHSDTMSFQSDAAEILDHAHLSNSSRSPTYSQVTDLDDELKKLQLELAQLSKEYSAVCQGALTAKDKLEAAIGSEEAALAVVEKEREKSRVAVEMAVKAQRIAEVETEKRKLAEKKYKIEAAQRQKALNVLTQHSIRYKKYSIEEIERATKYFSNSEKIGEGGYGPVYKAVLDHTSVAIKVLRSDIAEGHTQFRREVEVLSSLRHPNMVLLLGACPEYGCLVYEYMENGSLEDRLFRKNCTKSLSWPAHFRIAAEIATAMNFFHQTKPEPLVHRDLKPANILLDRNYVSKISDVGLSRLVPPSVADSVTQYHKTTAAGTFCYIDPEYQQTGMLGTKSDIYSLGIMLLQIITARPPMGLAYHVENAIEMGQFEEVLDPTVTDWPVEEALSFAKLALQCCELRKRDRPDLDSVILPELERLRDLGSKVTHEDRFDYMLSQAHSFEVSSSSSQESGKSDPEMHMENQSKYNWK